MKTIFKFILLLLCSSMSFQSLAQTSNELKEPSDSVSESVRNNGKSVVPPTSSSASNKRDFDWELSVIVVLLVVVAVLLFILLKVKKSGYEEDEYSYRNHNEISDLKEKIYELNQEIKKLDKEKEGLCRENLELKELLRQPYSDIDIASDQPKLDNNDEQQRTEEKEKSTDRPFSGITLYANLDVVNNRFTHVVEKSSKQSTYQINPDNGSFMLIKDEDLFDMCLTNLNSYGVLDACDVEGTYSKNKTVSIVPGRVKKENKDWVIVEKCKIKVV